MSDELKTIKFQMMLSESEAKQIDDWGFSNRIRSRAEAIRRLCQMGMRIDEASLPLLDKSSKSVDYLFAWFNEFSDQFGGIDEANKPMRLAEIALCTMEHLDKMLDLALEAHNRLVFVLEETAHYSSTPQLEEAIKEARMVRDETEERIRDILGHRNSPSD